MIDDWEFEWYSKYLCWLILLFKVLTILGKQVRKKQPELCEYNYWILH